MKRRRPLLIALAVMALLGAIWSYVLITAPPQETLDQRVHDVASQLKCLVCQGESVADSPALLAQQMRAIIRQQLQSGKSEQDVIQYFQSRYGDKILYSPPRQGFTLLAWLVPIAMLLGGALLLLFVLCDWQRSARTRTIEEDGEPVKLDEDDLKRYGEQLREELAADDPIFGQVRKEGSG